MHKTKLGITVGLLGAITYFTGLFSFWILVILAGYILLVESNEWLRKSAVKAVVIVVVFSLLSTFVGLGNNLLNFVNEFLRIFSIKSSLSYPFGLDLLLNNIIEIIEKLLLIILGIKALNQGGMQIKQIDKIVEKNM